jgi:homoserine dehydrogenase
LVPDVLARCATKEEYLERLEEGDEEMNRLREEARREGKVVRFVGVVDVAEKKIEARLGK